MENPNKNQNLNNNQSVRPGQAGQGQGTSETKDFSKKNEGQYSNDSSRSGSNADIKGGQGQNQKRDENLRQ